MTTTNDQQQPPPSAGEFIAHVLERCPECDLGAEEAEALPRPSHAPSTGATAGGRISGPLLDEGLLQILARGGCQCDPPGVGEEFCTGHCHLRAEVAQLRADLAQAQAESFDLIEQHAAVRNRLIIELEDERDKLRAQVEAMRGVVEAIADPLNSEWWSRDKARAALGLTQSPKHTPTCACLACIGTFGPVDTRPDVVDTTQIGPPI